MEKIGISFRNAQGEFRSFEDIITELADKWNTLTEAEKRASTKVFAGTYQRENMMVLLQNLSQARELTAQALEDEGLATERYQIYLESTEAKIKQFQLALQEMYTTIINSDMINYVIDTGTKVVNLINDLGGLPKVMGLVLASLSLFAKQSIAIDVAKVAVVKLATAFGTLNKASQASNILTGLGNIMKTNVVGAFKQGCDAIDMFGKGIINAKTLAGALVPALSVVTGGLSALVLVFTTYSALKNKHERELEEQRQALLEEAKAYQDNAKALQDLKKSYGEITISTKSMVEKKAELKELQQKLIDTYGSEVAGIDLVNGSYSEQITLLDKLNAEKKRQAELTLRDEYSRAQDEVDNITGKATFKPDVYGSNYDELEKIVNSFEGVSLESGLFSTKLKFDVDNAEEYSELLGDILQRMQAHGMENEGLYKDLLSQYEKVNASLSNLSEKQKDVFQMDYNTDLSDVTKKLGIDNLAEITEEQLDDIKDSLESTFSAEDIDNGYKDYVMSMLDTLPTLTEEVDKLKVGLQGMSMEDIAGAYKDLTDNAKNIQGLIDSIDEAKGITQETMSTIMSEYPQLLGCFENELELRQLLVQELENNQIAQDEAYRAMLESSEQYYSSKLLMDTQWVTMTENNLNQLIAQMGSNYQVDLENYASMEQAKAEITNDLIGQLGQAWADYFGAIADGMSLGEIEADYYVNGDESLGTTMDYEAYNKAKSLYDRIQGMSDRLNEIKAPDISVGSGSTGSSGGSSSKSNKTDYDAWLKDQIEQIEAHGKELDEQIELVEQKLSNAKDLGNSDLVKEYRQQLIDLHQEKKDTLVAEKEALQTLKAKLNGEEHIAEVQEKISDKILAWEKQKQELLEQEIALIDDKWEHELNGIKESQELLDNTYTDVEADPEEALRVAREKVKLQKEELAIAKEKLAEYRNLGLMEDSEEVIEIQTEIAGLNGDLIADQLGLIELEFEASNVDIEDLDSIKDLFASAIDISEFIKNYDEVIEAHNNIVNLTKVQLGENRKVINGLKEKLEVTTDVYEKNKLQDQLNSALAKEQELLADLIDQYQELADTQAELDAYGSEGRDAWEKENDKQIKALQDQKDALSKENDELERQNDLHEKELELEQLREKLENLKRNRNIQTIKQQEDGTWQWSYESDTKAIKETEADILKLQNEMQEAQNEIAQERQESMIDAEIERLEQLAEDKEEYYEDQKAKYLDFYEEQVRNTDRGLDDIDIAMSYGLDNVNDTARDAMKSLNKTMDNGMSDLFTNVSAYGQKILAEMSKIGVDPNATAPDVPSTPQGVLQEATGRDQTTTKDIITAGTGTALGVAGIIGTLGGLLGFDSGGYTGDWGNNDGRLALLHSKERVLNAEQTKSFEKLVDSITSRKSPKSISNLANNSVGGTSVVVQNMTVQAEDNTSLDRFINNVLHQSRAKTSLVGL